MRNLHKWLTPMMLGMHHDRPHGRRGRGWEEELFGSQGPFGPAGPFGAKGPFGPDGPFGPRGAFGPGGPRFGRRARRGDVRSAILHALAENEMNGYQIIGFVESRTDGAWRPSPGAVYPALSQLEDEGLIAQIDLDGQKAYKLTESGQEAVAEQAESPKPWEYAQDQRRCGPAMTELWEQFSHLAMALQAATRTGDEGVQQRVTEIVRRARRDIYNLLAEAGADEE